MVGGRRCLRITTRWGGRRGRCADGAGGLSRCPCALSQRPVAGKSPRRGGPDGRIYLIDWEYSGMNDPLWDLADLSVEAGFGPEQDRTMMEAYYGARLSPVLYSRLEVYKAMSDLHWSVWGFVQHAKGNPAEDFRSYGLERLGRSKARMSSADFSRHLSVLRRAGLQPIARTPTHRSQFTQLRRDLRRRSWPEISRLDFGFLA